MSWVYEQSTGNLSRSHRLVARGYAGKGSGKKIRKWKVSKMLGHYQKENILLQGSHSHTPIQGNTLSGYSLRQIIKCSVVPDSLSMGIVLNTPVQLLMDVLSYRFQPEKKSGRVAIVSLR